MFLVGMAIVLIVPFVLTILFHHIGKKRTQKSPA